VVINCVERQEIVLFVIVVQLFVPNSVVRLLLRMLYLHILCTTTFTFTFLGGRRLYQSFLRDIEAMKIF